MNDFSNPDYNEMMRAVGTFRASRPASGGLKAALVDMDGVLYDSMKYHTLAWKRLFDDMGICCSREEFYLYEGMTGAETIDMILRRETGQALPPEEISSLYGEKKRYFTELGRKEPMAGADRMLRALAGRGVRRVLVTGSAQSSLLDNIGTDYPGAFMPGDRVTARDVAKGKPDPEPYLRGLEIAGVEAGSAMVIENAPLGVRAGVAAGCFTVAITTGPIDREAFVKEGAHLVFPSMPCFADALPALIDIFNSMES